MNNLSHTISFVAGLVSFLSPCVLPLVPGFLAYLAGTGSKEGAQPTRLQLFLASVFFVLGFSVVFAALGVLLNTVLAATAYGVQTWLSRIGGIIIILFGLYLLGLIRPAFLEREHKLRVKRKFSSQYLTSFVFGAAFAVGWTPCVGAALGAILALAATQPGISFSLLLSYSLGLGVPFLIVGLFASQAQKFLSKPNRWVSYINKTFGVILIVLGILVFTESLSLIANLEILNRILL